VPQSRTLNVLGGGGDTGVGLCTFLTSALGASKVQLLAPADNLLCASNRKIGRPQKHSARGNGDAPLTASLPGAVRGQVTVLREACGDLEYGTWI
jgi:hypothetical protein